jgi:hypothetical protein
MQPGCWTLLDHVRHGPEGRCTGERTGPKYEDDVSQFNQVQIPAVALSGPGRLIANINPADIP